MPALTPEREAREQIDHMLEDAGWSVQSRDQANLSAAFGEVAYRLLKKLVREGKLHQQGQGRWTRYARV